jgi:ABC-type transport system involved in cytochrome c biogenesis permease subunit
MEIDIIPNLRDLFTVAWTLLLVGFAMARSDDVDVGGIGVFWIIVGFLMLGPMYCMWLGSYLQFVP